jgi:hypothetical protein
MASARPVRGCACAGRWVARLTAVRVRQAGHENFSLEDLTVPNGAFWVDDKGLELKGKGGENGNGAKPKKGKKAKKKGDDSSDDSEDDDSE